MKRYLALLLAAVFIVVMAVPASAAHPAKKFPITFNGRPVHFEVAPRVVDPGVTMVPFRAIFEKMGASVEWDGANRRIIATRGDTTIELSIGSKTAYVNGRASNMRVAPFIDNGRTLVELRFVSEAFGATVEFDPATTAITITDANWPPKRGGRLQLAMWNKPEGEFNPIVYGDVYGGYLSNLMYDGLWKFDNTFNPVPNLAEAWEWNDDYTKLTFYLKEGVTFFDGTPFTADDVIFTFKAMMHPKYFGPRGTGWENIKGFEAYHNGEVGETPENFEKGIVTPTPLEGLYKLDDHTVVFELEKVDAPFFINQTGYGIVSHKTYADIPVQDWGTAKDPYNVYANGTGPFMMDKEAEGLYYVMKANPNYHNGRPYIDEIVWRIVPSDVAVGEFQRGNIDFAEFQADTLDAYLAMDHVEVTEFPDLVYQIMGYNWAKGITSEKAVRHAINYAIDRQAIIHNLMKDHASSMYVPLHPLTWAYTEDVPTYDYNPEKARQILEEAGWVDTDGDGIRERNGQKLSLRLYYPSPSNPIREATAPVVQQMLKDIGVEVVLYAYDWGTLIPKVFEEHDFDLFFIGWSVGPEPDPTGLWDCASTAPGAFNPQGFCTEKSDQLIQAGRSTLDIQERMEIYHEWARHWAEESPAFIFYATNTLVAHNKRLQNFKPGPWGYLWNIEDLWLSE